ncbi:MAG: hypothetical protein HRU38_23445 [Saccharospirillaceae bacterium]|nr:hypothetical protein [Saccharospirillaceae bacterium]
MSLEPGRVAMMPRNVVVEYLHTKPFLRYFRKSFPPPLISPVTKEMISNRKKLTLVLLFLGVIMVGLQLFSRWMV